MKIKQKQIIIIISCTQFKKTFNRKYFSNTQYFFFQEIVYTDINNIFLRKVRLNFLNFYFKKKEKNNSCLLVSDQIILITHYNIEHWGKNKIKNLNSAFLIFEILNNRLIFARLMNERIKFNGRCFVSLFFFPTIRRASCGHANEQQRTTTIEHNARPFGHPITLCSTPQFDHINGRSGIQFQLQMIPADDSHLGVKLGSSSHRHRRSKIQKKMHLNKYKYNT